MTITRTIPWLEENKTTSRQSCLVWPFNRIKNGYGMLRYKGRSSYAHRVMCEMVHGQQPSSRHEAAHLCGNGHLGCVNPNHLAWKTRSENHLDKRIHGTVPNNDWGSRGKLHPVQVAEIRALKGRMNQEQLARKFNISQPTIRDILSGRTHKGKNSFVTYYPEHDAEILAVPYGPSHFQAVAKKLGRSFGSVRGRAYRLRAKTNSSKIHT